MDGAVLRRIGELVSLEHSFQEQELLSDDDRARLRGVQVELDQSWDLLRQRTCVPRDKTPIRPKSDRQGSFKSTYYVQ
jgi:hypothetical protein